MESPMTNSNKNNGTDVPPGDMLARLSINDVNSASTDGIARNGRSAGEEIPPADSLEVQLPPPRTALDAEAVGNSQFGSSGARKKNQAEEASQALHKLQAQAPTRGGSRNNKSPSLPSRTKEETPQKQIEEEFVEEEDEDSSEISASDEDGSWITWFCSLRGNEFFCEGDEDYIQVSFHRVNVPQRRCVSTYIVRQCLAG